jgi:hypothetical protein
MGRNSARPCLGSGLESSPSISWVPSDRASNTLISSLPFGFISVPAGTQSSLLPVGGPAPTAHRRNRLHVINGVAHRGVSARSGSRGQPPTLAGLGTRNQYRLHLVNTHLPSSVPSRSLGGVPTPSARLPVHRSLRGGEQADSRETQGNIHAEDLGCCSIRHLWSQRLIGRITRGCLPRPTAFMDSRWHAPGLRSWMDKRPASWKTARFAVRTVAIGFTRSRC